MAKDRMDTTSAKIPLRTFSSVNAARPAPPVTKATAMLNGALNFATYAFGGLCFAGSGSHSRCT